MNLTDDQERAEFKLKLITYIQDRDFKNYNNEREIEKATAKNDARLEVSHILIFKFLSFILKSSLIFNFFFEDIPNFFICMNLPY